jgi:1-pyrroline-5-carboxylate dehydrogenase
MAFVNQNTYYKYIKNNNVKLFHEKYQRAIDRVKSDFGVEIPLFINGEEYKSDTKILVKSPLDDRLVLGRVQNASQKHVLLAIKSANAAYVEWGRTNYKYRVNLFDNVAKSLKRKKFYLAAWLSYENGKNRYESITDIDEAIDFIHYYCNEMERNKGFLSKNKKPTLDSKEDNVSILKPYGTWVIIAPFNFPVALLVGMSIGALITGNTVIIKPSSDTPIIGYKIIELIKSGLPNGVMNYITGLGPNIGTVLVNDMNVDGVVFTGSRDVGLMIAKDFNKNRPRPFIAEMGGKNPAIVTNNADINMAAEGIIQSAFSYSGQKCSACSRVYVQEHVKDKLLAKLVQKTKSLQVGNPLSMNTALGPLINRKALTRFKKYITIASKDGNLLFGGNVIKNGPMSHGNYVEPTIVSDLPNNHVLLKKELFVPILCVISYKDIKDAIHECNSSEYGLTAGIYSHDKYEINQFLENIESGVVYVNRIGATTGAMVGCQSFGGWKNSGSSGKGTGGKYYLAQFMREQNQTIVG